MGFPRGLIFIAGKDIFSFDLALNYALAARGWSVSVWDDLALVDGADEKPAFLYDQGGMAETAETAETGRGEEMNDIPLQISQPKIESCTKRVVNGAQVQLLHPGSQSWMPPMS